MARELAFLHLCATSTRALITSSDTPLLFRLDYPTGVPSSDLNDVHAKHLRLGRAHSGRDCISNSNIKARQFRRVSGTGDVVSGLHKSKCCSESIEQLHLWLGGTQLLRCR
eukprot:6181763-Pleurochrysis_carterae.AAC.1